MDLPIIEPQVNSPPDPLREIANMGEGFQEVYSDFEDVPGDIREFIESHDINSHPYRCILKRVIDGLSDRSKAPYIRAWSDTIPTVEYIGLNYGPGEYMMVFQWRAKDVETLKIKSYARDTTLFVDDSFQDAYEEFQLKKQLERANRQQKIIANAKVKGELNRAIKGDSAEPTDKTEAGKAYFQEVMQAAQLMGLSQNRGIDWTKILPIALPLLPTLLDVFTRRGTESAGQIEKIYGMLIAQQSKSNEQLLEIAKAHGPQNGVDSMKEMRDMIFSAIDIKEAITPKKDSVGDKIFDLIAGMAPVVLELASKSQSARESDFRYKMAKSYMENNPEIVGLKNDSVELEKFVKRCDEAFGWTQTDIILTTGGIVRPVTCPRLPEQEHPQGEVKEDE